MAIVGLVALFAGMLIGASIVSFRFKKNLDLQAQELNEAQKQEQELRLSNKNLEQELADTKYALSETQKELNHCKNNSAQ